MAGRPLRILQVMRAPVGGLFRHVSDLTHELSAQGHAVGLVVDSLVGDIETEGKLKALVPSLALGLHRIAIPRTLGPGDLTTPFALWRLVRKLEVDVCHGHGAKGGFHARLAAPARPGRAAIYTPHGGVLHFPARSRSGRLFHFLERKLMTRTSAIIFESAYAEAVYRRIVGEPGCTARVIHNGLREAEFTPIPHDPDAADFVFVGELRALKGVHVLLEALAPLTRPDGRPARLHLVGDGPERARFKSQAHLLGLTERVRFAGAGSAHEAFKHGRCAVVPSLAESLPYIVLEAAAARLQVIASDVGGIPEIFGPTSGALVPPGDAAALGGAMQRFLDSPDGASEEIERRFAHIAEHFSVKRMSAAIEALYRTEIGAG